VAELHPDDGVDPRLLFGGADRSDRKRTSKTMQLCRQVERALALALAEQSAEPLLLAVVLDAVEPAPDDTRLRVTLRVAQERATAVPEVRAALSRCGARLRREVARAIHRKRTPGLAFELRVGEASRG